MDPGEYTRSSRGPLLPVVADGGGSGDGAPVPADRGPVRGESDAAVSVREVEDGEHVEHLPKSHEVRYVKAWVDPKLVGAESDEPGERAPMYERTPYRRWARKQALHAAAGAAADHVDDALGVDVGGGVTSAGVSGEESVPVVEIRHVYERSGDLVSEPAVAFEALVAATPSSVEATYVLEGREFTTTTPVYARASVLHEQ